MDREGTGEDGGVPTTAITPSLRLAGRPLPFAGRARMYVCGITPYDTTHLGHARTFVWADAVARVLRHVGVRVEVCRNVTDVDDVLTSAARRAGSPYDSFAAVQQYYFEQDMAALSVAPVTYEPRAHNHVTQVIALASGLLELGHAYVRDGAVFFRGGAAAAGVDREEALRLLAEFGDAPDNPVKEDPLDVALWTPSSAGEPAWPSPWGSGRPGWHAECAAMALTTFGPAMDLHAGGADLRFPHHAYESAMAESLTGVRPFARAWMHVGVVRHGGVKMAKSTGNLVFTADLLRDHPAAALRLLLLERPWAEEWDYEPQALERAADRLSRLHAAAGRPGASEPAGDAAVRALLDDLDVAAALDIAEEEGGAVARSVLAILALT
jgi:cysteinyl-tRNA synthetase